MVALYLPHALAEGALPGQPHRQLHVLQAVCSTGWAIEHLPTRWCVRQAAPELQVEGLVHEAGSRADVHGGSPGVVQLGPPRHGTGHRRLAGYSYLP